MAILDCRRANLFPMQFLGPCPNEKKSYPPLKPLDPFPCSVYLKEVEFWGTIRPLLNALCLLTFLMNLLNTHVMVEIKSLDIYTTEEEDQPIEMTHLGNYVLLDRNALWKFKINATLSESTYLSGLYLNGSSQNLSSFIILSA